MIERISIENFVVLREAELELSSGLTAVTGETGSGKTLIIGALLAALGSDVASSVVGPHADHAWVEAEFRVPPGFWNNPSVAALAEVRPEGEETLVLARKIMASGRTRAFAWGRSVSRADLQAAGSLLVSVTGQHANHRLTIPAVQRELLDSLGDAGHQEALQDVANAWHELGRARTALEQIQSQEASLLARAAQIQDDLDLISSVDPSADDEEQLTRSRAIARNAAELHQHLSAALESLTGSVSGSGVIDALGSAWSQVSAAAAVDDAHSADSDAILAAQDQVSEVAANLRSSIETLADAPAQIEQVEERLGAYDELHRRFGGTTASVLARWEQLKAESLLVSDMDGSRARAQAQLVQAEADYHNASRQLTQSRLTLADQLEAAVIAELADLGMAHSVFVVALEPAAEGVRGAETVEFRVAPAAGIEPKPISAVASGGELSRIALALHVSLGANDTPTIIFDEIDAGIGGITAHAVGARLARIAQSGTQVICVTHLAQVAAQSSGFVLIQRADDGTTVRSLTTEDELVGELCRMVGAPPTDPSAWAHAENLRAGLYTEATEA